MDHRFSSRLLVQNSIFNLVYNILNLLFPVVILMYVSRVLYPDGIGMVAYGQNLTSYFLALATLGLPTYGVREIAKARMKQDEIDHIFTELLVINWISTTVSVICFLLFVSSEAMREDRILMLACGVQLFFNYLNIDWFYQGIEEYSYIVVRSCAIKIISMVCVILLVRHKGDYILYALISSVAYAGNYLFNVIHARKKVRLNFTSLNLRRHLKPLIFLGMTILLSTLYSKLDITMLGSMCTEAETGLYSNAFQMVAVACCISASISSVFLPRLSFYFHTDPEQFQELLTLGMRIICFVSFPMFAGLVILAPEAVRVFFGEPFTGAVVTIRILAFLILIKSFGDLLCYQLSIATGQEKERLPAYVLASSANLFLNFLMIPLIGRNGAAIASVISELLLNLTQVIKIKKKISYVFQWKALFQGITTTVFMGFVVWAVCHVSSNGVIHLILGTASGMLAYVGINILTGNRLISDMIHMLRKNSSS